MSLNKIVLDTIRRIHLHIIYDCVRRTTELSSCNRNHTVHSLQDLISSSFQNIFVDWCRVYTGLSVALDCFYKHTPHIEIK